VRLSNKRRPGTGKGRRGHAENARKKNAGTGNARNGKAWNNYACFLKYCIACLYFTVHIAQFAQTALTATGIILIKSLTRKYHELLFDYEP